MTGRLRVCTAAGSAGQGTSLKCEDGNRRASPVGGTTHARIAGVSAPKSVARISLYFDASSRTAAASVRTFDASTEPRASESSSVASCDSAPPRAGPDCPSALDSV
jgi:hypothetical protein